MPDRVPIGTHPGLASALVATDLPLATLASEGSVSRAFLRRSGSTTAGLEVDIRNATGGGGDGFRVSFGTGVSAVGVGSITGTAFYARVVTADANSENLSGYFELEPGVGGVLTALTTLARVLEQLGQTSDAGANDAYLGNLISGVSARIQRKIGRSILETSIASEPHSGDGRHSVIPLLRRPITGVSNVWIEGTAIAAAERVWDMPSPEAGLLRYIGGDDPGAKVPGEEFHERVFPAGFRNVLVSYTAGYATVPEDLALAATTQAAYDYQKRGTRIAERGQVIDAGGSAQFLTGPWAPGVLDILAAWRDRELR